ncbi:MAG: ketopantoate reductase family protein [Sandaracinaceae bacterium]
MDVLIVGAGAVGQVYGACLAQAGDRVSVLVKAKHDAAARAGYRILERGRARTFEPAAVLTEVSAIAETRFDEVWLAVAATSLDPAWLDALIAASGEATIVYLQPGGAAEEALASRVDSARLVAGGIGFIAYEAILSGETREPGTVVIFPPGGTSRFDGPGETARAIVLRLRRGGCPARVDHDARAFIALTGAVIQCLVAALEAESWSFAKLRRGDTLALMTRAARQAVGVAAADSGVRPPLFRTLLRPALFWVFLWLAPRFAPFALEAYLEHHFVKVRAQTREAFAEYLASAKERALPADAIAELDRVVFHRES